MTEPSHDKRQPHAGQRWLERPVTPPASQPTYQLQPRSYPQPEVGIPRVPHRWSVGSAEWRALGAARRAP